MRVNPGVGQKEKSQQEKKKATRRKLEKRSNMEAKRGRESQGTDQSNSAERLDKANLPKRNKSILIEVVKVCILTLFPASVKTRSLSPWSDVTTDPWSVGFSYMAFIMLRSFLLFLVYWVFLIIKVY